MPEIAALARNIGHKIRQRRLERNLTQEDLAQGLFSKSYISQLERGTVNPSLRALHLLAKRLDVSYTWLLESGTSSPALTLQTASASYYLGDSDGARRLLERALTDEDSFTHRDQIDALVLKARLLSEEKQWENVIQACETLDPLIQRAAITTRDDHIATRYLAGQAWYHLGNRRQAIRQWEDGLDYVNKPDNHPTPDGLRLLRSLSDLYDTLGDERASNALRSRLTAIAAQTHTLTDLSRWILARQYDQTSKSPASPEAVLNQADDVKDAEAWARASVLLSLLSDLH